MNTESAIDLIGKYETKFKDICMFPKANPIIENPSLNNNCLRKSIIDNFLIVYSYNEVNDIVDIVRVIYAKKDYIKEI